MSVAICPGSFDPITRGHVDIIERASKLFDRLIVVVLTNPSKKPTFTPQERVDFIKRATQKIGNVEADHYDGLLVDYVRAKGSRSVIKGLRAVSDFEAEFQMAIANKTLDPEIETLFMCTSAEHMFLSSSIVKQIAQFGGDISGLIPPEIADDIMNKLGKDVR